jgi:DNA-binding GntR family transcriptional regulator
MRMKGVAPSVPAAGKKLSEQAYDLIKRDIIEGRLEPGGLLDEGFVSKRYGIGRTPFREACHRLEPEGLIKVVPHRGAFVADFSNDDINDLFELRSLVEPGVAELAATRREGQDLAVFEANLEECRRLNSVGRRSQVGVESNLNSKEFHVQVAALTRNREMIRLVEGIHDKLSRIVIHTGRRSPDQASFNSLHPEIFDAIRCHDHVRAREAMRQDIHEARKWIRDLGMPPSRA